MVKSNPGEFMIRFLNGESTIREMAFLYRQEDFPCFLCGQEAILRSCDDSRQTSKVLLTLVIEHTC